MSLSMNRERKQIMDLSTSTVRQATEYPNQLWLIDHHQLDLVVADSQTGKVLGRPWLTVVMDDYSRTICGLYLGMEPPTGTSAILALRHAILPKAHAQWIMHGVPELLHINHGSGSRSKQLDDVCEQYDIAFIRP